MFSSKIQLLVTLAVLGAASASPARRTPTRRQSSDFPEPPATSSLSEPITISAGESFTPDVLFTRYDRGSGACSDQAEGGDSDAVFLLEEGATLSSVVIGADQAEGIHCLGSCTLNDVYFEDVCEDAMTFKQSGGTSYVNGGGAKHAEDKVLQHNGAGTVVVNDFYVEDFGKLYRSCGNCDDMYERHIEINNLVAVDGSSIVGINENYGDTATITSATVTDVGSICVTYIGNDNGDEPTKSGEGPDDTNCLYSEDDIIEA